MFKILSYKSYKLLTESSNDFSNEINDVINEANLTDFIDNPIKWVKLKNNGKKYQKALVQKELTDLEYRKKSKDLPDEKRKQYKDAIDSKKKSLDDIISAINDRMDVLASTDTLKQALSLIKTKAKISAAQTAIKSSEVTANEIEKYKKIIKDNTLKAAKIENDIIKNKEPKQEPTEDKEEKEPTEDKEPKQEPTEDKEQDKEEKEQEKEAIDVEIKNAKDAYNELKDGEDERAKLNAKIKFKQAQQKKARLDGNDELYQGLGDDIGKIMVNINKLDRSNNKTDAGNK